MSPFHRCQHEGCEEYTHEENPTDGWAVHRRRWYCPKHQAQHVQPTANAANALQLYCETCDNGIGRRRRPLRLSTIDGFRLAHRGHTVKMQHALGGLWYDLTTGIACLPPPGV
jgi:hypothetical protein